MKWWKNLKGKVALREPLRLHTTSKIGGPAKYFIEPKDNADLKLLLAAAGERKLAVRLIGSGSNILVKDKAVNAAVVKLSSPYFKKVDFKSRGFSAGAGCPLSRVIKECKDRGRSALEELSGIPGTIGGALAMNAGVRGKNIGDLVEEVTVMDYNGKLRKFKPGQIKFAYRSSGLSRYIILSAAFRASRKTKKEIEAEIRKCLAWRRVKQELTLASAGCAFKNPLPEVSAGGLIDQCGLKGKHIGGAAISRKHANFILNAGSATAKDVTRLMRLAARRVKNKFSIDLQPEIKIW
jgi:UDP-N-acetylmuramate dehydrogenase